MRKREELWGRDILVPRGRTPFGQHQEITTSGLVQHRKSTIHGLPVTLRMLRVKSDKSDWFWFQSIVFTKPFKNRMSLDQARGSDFLVLTKRSAASGDENGVENNYIDANPSVRVMRRTCANTQKWATSFKSKAGYCVPHSSNIFFFGTRRT